MWKNWKGFDDPITITGEIVKQTDKAILFSDGIMEEWIPKSQIIEINDLEGSFVEITIPEWLAQKKFG